MQKYCRDCGCLIAVKPDGVRDGRFNAVQYCPACAAERNKNGKNEWRRTNRHDCRVSNRQYMLQAAATAAYMAELEQRVRLLQEENAALTAALKGNGTTPNLASVGEKAAKKPGFWRW